MCGEGYLYVVVCVACLDVCLFVVEVDVECVFFCFDGYVGFFVFCGFGGVWDFFFLEVDLEDLVHGGIFVSCLHIWQMLWCPWFWQYGQLFL